MSNITSLDDDVTEGAKPSDDSSKVAFRSSKLAMMPW